MSYIQAAVIENEEMYRKQLEEKLNLWAEKDGRCKIGIRYFSSGEEFLKVDETDYHIIFMDIELDGRLDGLDTARQVKERGSHIPIAFLTVHDIYVYEGYSVNAIAYILKPVSYENVCRCMETAYQRMYWSKYIHKNRDQMISVYYKDILYFQSDSHYTDIVIESGRISHKVALSELSGRLPHQFVRCHRTAIVNIMHVKFLYKKEIVLTNDTLLTISKPYYESVTKIYLEWNYM
jgi:two-component system response regulator LytT